MEKRHLIGIAAIAIFAMVVFLVLQTENVEEALMPPVTKDAGVTAPITPDHSAAQPSIVTPSSRPAEPGTKATAPTDSMQTKSEPPKTEKLQPANPLFSGSTPGFPKLDPKVLAVLEKSRSLINANQPEAALEELEKAVKEDPRNEFYQVELAMMLNHTFRNPGKAEEVFKRLIENNPESRMAAAAYGDFLVQNGKGPQATKYLVQAASGNDAPTESHNQLGQHYMDLRAPQRAVEQFEVAYRKANQEITQKEASGESTLFARQNAARIRVNEGFALVQAGRPEEAARMLREAEIHLGTDSQEIQALRHAISGSGRRPSE